MISTLGHVGRKELLEIEEEKRVRKTTEIFLLFSLGSQFDHLIKQEMEKLGIFCLVADPGRVTAEDVRKIKPKGIVLSGGPVSIWQDPPPFDKKILDLAEEMDIQVLGICLGFQLWADYIGGRVIKAKKREFGTHKLAIVAASPLSEGCEDGMPVLESHGDIIAIDGVKGFEILAKTENTPVAAGRYKNFWGVQFHPEVTETVFGPRIFENFCLGICRARDRFPAQEAARQKIIDLRKKIGDSKVLLALSGGSDSSTVAYLLKEAMAGRKNQLRGVYIRGIDRPDDEAFVLKHFGDQSWIDLKAVDATEMFLEALKGKFSMAEKRIAMRKVYKFVLEREAKEFGAKYIAQGTIYTDLSESGKGYATNAKKAVIKLQHNVGLDFGFEELTPLDDCVKDSGRNIGRAIGTPEELLTRQPFPGPALIVRIEDEVTAEKLRIARQVDKIFIDELRLNRLYSTIWQAGAVVTRSITTCTKGDDAANGLIVALWAVWSVNGFTAQAAELPWEFIKKVSRRITNEVPEVGGVVYRVSDKPPTTIEWG